MTLEFDRLTESDSSGSAKQSDSLASKLCRELYVVGGGLCDGIKDSASQALHNKEKLLPQVGVSAGVGAVLALAQSEAGVLKLGSEIAGGAFSAGFVKDLLNKDRLNSIGSAIKDTWNSADNVEANRSKMAAGAGQFAFDSALMMGSGALGAAVARGSKLALQVDAFGIKGPSTELGYSLGRNDASLNLGPGRRLPLFDVFPDTPLEAPRKGKLLTQEVLGLSLTEISNRERVLWPKGAPSGADLEWEPSQESVEARRDAQSFVGSFMQRDYLGALKTAVESKMMERVALNPSTKRSDVRIGLDEFADQDALCQKLDQLCDLGKFDWRQTISSQVDAQRLAVVVPRPIVEFPSGKAVALVDYVPVDQTENPSYKVQMPEKTLQGEALSAEELEQIRALRNSEAGQRVIAETALIAFEESIAHLNQHAKTNGDIISPSFAQFSRDYAAENESRTHMQAFAGAISRAHPLRSALYEQEVPALLYDAGMPLSVVERHYYFGSHHVAERKPVMEFLKNLDGSDAGPKSS